MQPRAPTGPTKDHVHKPLTDPWLPYKIATQSGVSAPRIRPHLRKIGASFPLTISNQDKSSTPSGALQELEDKEIVATLDDPIPVDHQQASDFDGDQSLEDHHSFEIKGRSTTGASMKTHLVMKGHVHQVVEGFEAGLVIAREEGVPRKGSSLNLNEYGSNIVDPIMENQK
ncbi:unnamed protein product [Linum trigynum]|uniref:Uncharacterized protein n=1 Tax=Linum trigynum TaxID=586398 RepID=A0AAV2CS18_9ROSI